MFLQITPDIQERLFDTNPSTVYGILVFLLAVAVVALWLQSNKRYEKQIEGQQETYENQIGKLVELNVSCVETLKDLSAALDKIREAGVNNTEDLRREIGNTREHIAEKINNLAANQRYGNERNAKHDQQT